MTSVARRRDHDSGDYSDGSHQENDQDTSGNGGGPNDESDYDSAASDSEHSDRDPESQEAERRVDDDEDRSNPQYIPKRGTFYEHDDRTAASGGEESSNTVSETASEKKEGGDTPSERRRGPRKSESLNKWSHDKYNENEQMPKSRDELVAIYGYDIRNEDAPPHARRNRRYGRGPNKYTRTWEDEEAYKRQAAAPPARKPPNPEDFPELDAVKNTKQTKRSPRPRSKSQPSSTDSVENGAQLRRNASIKTTRKPAPRTPRAPARKEREEEKLPPVENLTITATVFNNSQGQPQRKVNATVAQQRPVPTEQGKKKPPPPAQNQQQQNSGPPNKSPPQQQQQQKPAPAVAHEPRGSKRYSSLRQRPLDTYSPPQPQHHRYHEYPPTNQQANQHQGSPVPQQLPHPQQLMQQMHRTAPVNQPQHGPSPPHQPLPQQQIQQQQIQPQQLPPQQLPQPQIPQQQQLPQQQLPPQPMPQQQISQPHNQQQVRLGILEQPQMVSHPHHTIHNMPQHTIGQLQPAQGYAPPAMMPAQYMQQGGSGAVFGGAPIYAQPPAPYPHQIYPHHNYATQAGGVTYYSCAEQDALPRAQRRPTAAIPIVRPAQPDRPPNSEKDNIDRIVENMFVRKPWPATHGADSKEKSETRNSQEPQSKESSQPNSLTSSSISTDSKPSESIEQEKETQIEKEPKVEKEEVQQESVEEKETISSDA